MSLSKRLEILNITLPAASGPFGAYRPTRRIGQLLYVSGQIPVRDGGMIAQGPVPSRCSIEEAREAARLCVINALAAVQAADGGIDHLTGVLRIGAFVNSDPGFGDQPKVANAASELLQELFGEPGRHVRAAVGVNALPLDASVEIEFIFTCE